VLTVAWRGVETRNAQAHAGTKAAISLYGAGVQVEPAGRTARLVEKDAASYQF
jgi:hypothetical protein